MSKVTSEKSSTVMEGVLVHANVMLSAQQVGQTGKQ